MITAPALKYQKLKALDLLLTLARRLGQFYL
jgi:hypothetical protein